MLRPPIDADIQRIDHADGLRLMSTIFPDAIEKGGPPRIARQEAVQIATEHARVAPADLGARTAHERLTLVRDRVAATVADLVAAERRVRHGPRAHCPALSRPLLRLEHGADRQQAESWPRAGPAFRPGAVVQAQAQHLIAAAEAEDPGSRAMRVADGLRHAGHRVVYEVGHC